MSEGNMITVTLRELARDFQREIARLKERLKQYGGDLR
jgi:hypothetical protein